MKIEYSREKLMNLFLKGRKKVLSIGIIIFTLIITLSIYRTQTKKIESLHVDKDTALKKNEVLKEIGRSEKTIKLYKNLFSRKDASSVMNTFSNIARDFNVRLISVSPGNEENQPLSIKTPFTLVIGTDNYHTIGKFISSIENQPGIYFVETISIRSQEEAADQAPRQTNKLIVNITLSIIEFKG